ncbi:MAG: hypothetical protein AAF399_12460 [Bacteroidota bacterium]
MDLILVIELCIVAALVAVQVVVFFRNRQSVKALGETYPHAEDLSVQATALATATTGNGTNTAFTDPVDLIEEKLGFSPTFRDILQHTNAYLGRHGSETRFETLQELAERKSTSEERAIETSIAMPLYLGLMGTFSGVIIGLIKIATVGVSDVAIQTFIGGVLIGMIGSATGLALTVWGNQLFKTAKQLRDRHQFDYFTFLQTHLLPASEPDPSEPLSNLKHHLAAFQEGFVQYQQHINASIRDSVHMYADLKEVFQQIKRLEPGLSSLKDFLISNEELMHKQVKYFDLYAQKIEQFSHQVKGHMEALTPGQVQTVNGVHPQTLSAYAKMEQFLSTLAHTDRFAFADALSKDLKGIKEELAYQQSMSLEINSRLLEHLQQDSQQQQQQNRQLEVLSDRMEQLLKLSTHNPMQKPAFQFFIYAGVAAFVTGVVSGAVYLINLI